MEEQLSTMSPFLRDATKFWMTGIFVCVLLFVADACTSGSYYDCPAWPSCSKICGGGERCRTCKSCVGGNDTTFCETCNAYCLNGGEFLSGLCNCQLWRSGDCCDHCTPIFIAHCLPGKQECGGSPDGVRCTQCDNGYTPGGYGKGCIDINECQIGTSKCSQKCTNTDGSYQCGCDPGYVLDANGLTCSEIKNAVPILESTFIKKKSLLIADGYGIMDFADNYHSALTQFTQLIAYEADIRLSGVQNSFTAAQRDLSAAQNWLAYKASALDSANAGFTNAVRALDVAKVKLEEAKRPFQNAVASLEEAQRNVDRLCKIKTCAQICVPGIHCSICSTKVWFVTIYYPCCSFTLCLFSVPDPICELVNAGCRVLRGIAYAALEVAQLALRVPMLVLDAANVAVSVAQVVVDRSRVVLDIAKVAVSMAHIALESAKRMLEDAKLTLEAVKAVVKLGFMALNFVIKYSLQSLFAVRNCRYDIGSTKDFPIFYVQCEVNAFMSGFETIDMNINFNDPIQSIWNAAKVTIEMTLNKLDNVLTGRKRREILDKTVAGLYMAMRFARNADVDDAHFEMFANQTLNDIFIRYESPDKSQSVEYTFRKQLFTEKCIIFTRIHRFFYDTTSTLFELVHYTAATLKNMTSLKVSLRAFNARDMSNNLSHASIGVDPRVAQEEFNISISDMEKAIDGARDNIATDPLLAYIVAFEDDAFAFLDSEADGANKIMIVNQWIAAMNNVTVEYFDNETCTSFLDCAHYAIATLYEQFMAVNVTNQTESINDVSQFEDMVILLVGNSSHTIEDVDLMSVTLLSTLRQMKEHGVFCSKAPEMIQPLRNLTVKTGKHISLVCNASGDPKPIFWWYKDKHIISDQHSMTLTILNSTIDDAGWYHCIAGNLVANFSFDDAFVTVLADVSDDTDDRTSMRTTVTTGVTGTADDQDDSVNIDYVDEQTTGVELEVVLLPVLLGVAAICVAVGVFVWRRYISIRARKGELSKPTHGSTNECQANVCP